MKNWNLLKNTKFFFFFILIILLANSGKGPDYQHYINWTFYFANSDFLVMSDYHKTRNGLPMSSWFYGSGLISGLLSKIIFTNEALIIKINSIILCSFNIFLIYKIIQKKGYSELTNFFIICIFYLVLPAGFYLNKFSSEAWTIFFTLFSILLIDDEYKKKNLNYFLIGICFYFLILIKPTNIFLCIGLMSVFYIKNIKENYRLLFIGTFLIFLSLSLILIYQKLLLGNFFLNFYSYGDDQFQSFSLINSHFIEVLFSSWHGISFYHPVFLLINLLLLISIFLRKNKNNMLRYFCIICLCLFISQLIIQGSHATWWMGTGTYGARGFAGISVLIFYLSLDQIHLLKKIRITHSIKIIFFLLLMWHTYILSMGVTNFVNYNSFLNKFFSQSSLILLTKITFLCLITFYINKRLKYDFLKFFKLLTIILFAFIIIDQLFSEYKNNSFYILILGFFIAYILTSFTKRFNKNKFNFLFLNAKKIISFLLIFVFLNSFYFQYNLFSQYEKKIDFDYIGGNNFNCFEAISSYNEYSYIPGYKEEKKLWYNFLEKSKCFIN